MSKDADCTQAFASAVQVAFEAGKRLTIVGGGTKSGASESASGRLLEVREHTGVLNYEPTEQVLTARAGTPLTAIRQLLAPERQKIASEPPEYHGRATLGGTLAMNLSGSARPWAGSLRDHVLGVTLVNGRGEVLRFGGRVMKNVAGYDISRLQAGARGSFGVITGISMRVHPVPEADETRVQECDAATALQRMLALGRRPLPLAGSCWEGGRLWLRLAGGARAVAGAVSEIGGETVRDALAHWNGLGEPAHALFAHNANPWRMSVRASAPLDPAIPPARIDWGGALRWYPVGTDEFALKEAARAAAGHVQRFPTGVGNGVPAMPSALRQIHERLRRAFDPGGVFVTDGA